MQVTVCGRPFPIRVIPGHAGVRLVAGAADTVIVDLTWDDLARLDNEVKAAREAAGEFAEEKWTVEDILAREG